jgi:hypothetical protein
MQTARHFGLYDRAIRTKIGESLRTVLVPTEPPPKRLLELLRALDQPKGGGLRVTKRRSARAKQLSDTPENKRVEKIPGGYVVRDANGQALVYLYCGATETEALQANVLTEDQARRLAINIAKLNRLSKRND